jgi:hypothetical protein
MARLFVKTINSLRQILKNEFVMPKLYEKIIVMYA